MKLFLTCVFFLSLLTGSLKVFSQNETKKWYFGKDAALDFMTIPPSPITHTTMFTVEGSSSISDAAGVLLFYSDGATVWNSQQLVMANGTGLQGNFSTAQSCLFVKQPGNTNIYFLFTLDLQGGPNGLKYSVIDKTLAAGMGSVTIKNVPLFNPGTEQLSGVVHCNGTDIWVVSHQFNNNNFVAYLVTSAGVSNSPVITSIGPVIASSGQGTIKLSPNGKKLGMTYFNGSPSTVQIFDFDNSTGVVSNSLVLSSVAGNCYGCEFSPDATKFYTGGVSVLNQWDLCAGSAQGILNSKTTISTAMGMTGFLALQNGPDGKMYSSRTTSISLGIINNPNVAGTGCNYNSNGPVIPGSQLFFGLPNFVCSYYKQVMPFTHSVSLTSCTTASLTAIVSPTVSLGCSGAASPPPISCLWDFGNPASGVNNTSTSFNPIHVFTSAGSYTVKLILYAPCNTDTIRQVINIAAKPPVGVISFPTTICQGQSSTLTVVGANTYSWNTGAVTNSIVVSPTITPFYSVVGTNTTTGCQSTATINVFVMTAPVVSVSGNFSICAGMATTLSATGANSYSWNTGSTNPGVIVSPTTATSYSVTGFTNNFLCTSVKTITVAVSSCVGIETIAVGNLVNLYPNPFSYKLNVEVVEPTIFDINNLVGELIYTTVLQKGKNEIDLSRLAKGIYLVVLKTQGGLETARLIKND